MDREEYIAFNARRPATVVAVLVLCIWGFINLAQAHAESEAVSKTLSNGESNNPDGSWITTEIEGQVDRTILIHLDLSPYPPPAGAFYTAVVDVLESPAGSKPEILPGVPEIRVRCHKAGIYRLRIQANLIEKSSCALAKAQILKLID